MYNLTEITTANDTLQFVQKVNVNLMGNWLGVMILMVLYVIVFLAFLSQTRQPVRSMTGAAFISLGLSILMFLLGLVPMLAIYISAIILAAGLAAWNLD